MMDDRAPLPRLKRIEGHFRTRVVAGLLLAIPIIATYIVLRFFVDFISETLEPVLDKASEGPFAWLSEVPVEVTAVVLTILVLYIAGVVTATVLGRRLARRWHNLLECIPVVRPIYRIVRQTIDVFSGGTALQSSKVVLLEYPRQGVLSLGLVTGTYAKTEDEILLTIYIPTIPNPTSGFLAIVNKEQVLETDLTFEDAMKIVVSAGVLTEEVVRPHLVNRERQPAP